MSKSPPPRLPEERHRRRYSFLGTITARQPLLARLIRIKSRSNHSPFARNLRRLNRRHFSCVHTMPFMYLRYCDPPTNIILYMPSLLVSNAALTNQNDNGGNTTPLPRLSHTSPTLTGPPSPPPCVPCRADQIKNNIPTASPYHSANTPTHWGQGVMY